jgi:hypothetical protein
VKILYLSSGGNTQDYLRDCVFHGLRSLLGPDVVDVGKLDSMYVGADRSQMYGRGMTLYSELPDIPVDRTDILAKIRNKYFDLILWGSVHRNQDYLAEAESMYDYARLVALDGEDHPGFLNGLRFLTLKRELYSPQPRCKPIHFAIPKEKILPDPTDKIRLMSPLDPIRKSTYIYKDEASYYQQYAESYYAPTMKKAGWDCLRHYEILSQWCLPYFRCFDQCPPTICENLPRPELNLIRQMIECLYPTLGQRSEKVLAMVWDLLMAPMVAHMRTYMTTERLAIYIFDSIGVARKETIQCVS